VNKDAFYELYDTTKKDHERLILEFLQKDIAQMGQNIEFL